MLQLGTPSIANTARWRAPSVQDPGRVSACSNEAANVAAPPQAVTSSNLHNGFGFPPKVFQDTLQLLRQLLKIQKQLKPKKEFAAWSSPTVSAHASVFCSFILDETDGARLDIWQTDDE